MGYIRAEAMVLRDVQDNCAAVCQIRLPLLMPELPISHLLAGDRERKTHREVSVEVVFPVKKRLPVYGTVESQSRHHRCLDTPFVKHLGTHRGKLPDKKAITNTTG